MSPSDEPLIAEPVYLALSRPPMWLGVPLDAALPIAIAAVLVLLVTNNPVYAVMLGAAGFMAARLIVRHEPNAFRLLNLGLRTKWRNRDRGWWGGSSYSPLPVAPLRRKGFAGE
ncbi:type IV secretion system protein VirB3 [Sphingomonas vulcanisoli]|uniref:Type IV secretion system protein VirB3 n=1 Tax=Sphingomonas vulcanisoli TaxID=1658060 RepID=A0ABX0TXB1_9SPHN|nr:type IV secretion system protein VirB3 [Sphingomonas vulcanisoli]